MKPAKILIFTFAIFTAMFFAGNAGAAPASCSISSSPGVGFGNYDIFPTTPTDSTGTITIVCDKTTWATVAIGQSPNSGGFNPRQMRRSGETDLLSYNIFTDSSRTIIWGDGTGGTQTITEHAFNDTPLSLTMYGRIPAGQDVSTGFYSENLTATVTP